MILILLSFFSGILTILAPCVLPLLPIILAGSLEENNKKGPYIIIASLAISMVFFSILLKASTIFIGVPQSFWAMFSGILIISLGIITIFPDLWKKFSYKIGFDKKSNEAFSSSTMVIGNKKYILMGLSLGPVFASCSPTYAIILAIVLPSSFLVGILNLVSYALGLSSILLLIAIFGQKLVSKLKIVAAPKSKFKKILGVIFLIVGLSIFTGFDKKVETKLIEKGFIGLGSFEEKLLDKVDINENPISDSKYQKKSPGNNELNFLIESLKKYEIYNTKAPDFIGLGESFNIDNKPSLSSLKGKITLVNFWTYGCINCQNTIDDVKFLNKKYGSELNILGIHSPEFSYEKNIDNLKDFLKKRDVKYPVIQDNNLETWKAYNNKYWPAFYLIDSDLNIRYFFKGENQRQELDKATSLLLKEKNMKNNYETAYFAGGCFWCIEGILQAQEGVIEAISGYAGGDKESANYEDVSSGTTNHREAVKVIYDPNIVSYEKLLETFLKQIDPTDNGGQFADRGNQYTTAVYFQNENQEQIATKILEKLDKSGEFEKPIVTSIEEFTTFFDAEDYHQNYSENNNFRYNLYKKGSGRESYIDNNENKYNNVFNNNSGYVNYSSDALKNSTRENTVLFFHATWCPTCNAFEKQVLSEKIPENILILKVDYDKEIELKKKYNVLTQTTFVLVDKDGNLVKRWIGGKGIDDVVKNISDVKNNSFKKSKTYTKDELKQLLTPMQYKVAVEGATEPPFNNEYWNNKADGIYVDVIDGTPLFSSLDKYDSGTGWPSFTRPIEEALLEEKEDNKLFTTRTEVKSKSGDSHLGHVFDDGPSDKGGLRYCINSASLRFISLSDLEKEGYGEYIKLFDK